MKTAIKTFFFFIIIFFCNPVQAKTFKVATYNVENLFDLNVDGIEYIEYIPNNAFGWNKATLDIKLSNIARVIKDLGADIVALQEVESRQALILLREKLKTFNVDYPFSEIADSKHTVVKCAILSKFPIIKKEEIEVNYAGARNILKVTVDIDSNPLTLFINHWKSKRSPESFRIACAEALKGAVEKLKDGTDFVLLGDFNANYNEYETFKNLKNLNDSKGMTGINHILGTIENSKPITENMLLENKDKSYLYNLWLEIDKSRRWTYDFFNEKSSADSIIICRALYDGRGISYVDNSFDKFAPNYLFEMDKIYRWQRSKKGKGKHSGYGYSDHLPIFAYFSTKEFRFKQNNNTQRKAISEDRKTNSAEKLFDLNKVSAKELQAINGIGPVLAERIIAGRPYKSVNDLLKTRGIGQKKFKKIKSLFFIND